MLGSVGVGSRVGVSTSCGNSDATVSVSLVCVVSAEVGWTGVSCSVGSGSSILAGVGSVVGSCVGSGWGVGSIVCAGVGLVEVLAPS